MRGIPVIVLVLLCALPAIGQDYAIPYMGGHHFVPATALAEPFITTSVQTTVSLGKSVNATVPVIDIAGDQIIGTANADIFLAGISFRYQHRVKDWLSVGLGLTSAGRVGTSTPSLVSEGLTGSVGYDIGWLMRIHQSEKVIVSGSVGLGSSSATFINLLEWADDILAGQDASLARNENSLKGIGGLHAAWGISRRFGLLGALEFKYGEAFDGKGTNNWDTDVRLGLSYDIEQDLSVPLGLSLVGGLLQINEGTFSGSDIWFWSGRLALQTREDFSIGLDLSRYYLESQTYGNEQQVSQFSIDMRYYY